MFSERRFRPRVEPCWCRFARIKGLGGTATDASVGNSETQRNGRGFLRDKTRKVVERCLFVEIIAMAVLMFSKPHAAGSSFVYWVRCEMQNDLDQLQKVYKAAVEEWIAAIKQEEALATVDHSVAEVDQWEQAHFREDGIRSKVKAAKGNMKARYAKNSLASEVGITHQFPKLFYRFDDDRGRLPPKGGAGAL
jgi:hypothetical protein